jgi:hypothetical protein
MAIKSKMKANDNRFRADFPDAYHRVCEVSVNNTNKTMRFSVKVYASESARRFVGPSGNIASAIAEQSFCLSIEEFGNVDGDNLFAKAYNYLKRLPAYSLAEDY